MTDKRVRQYSVGLSLKSCFLLIKNPCFTDNSATEFIAPREMEKVPGVTLLGGPIVMLPAALEKDRIIKRKKGTEASYDEVDGYKGNISDGVRDNKSKRKPLLEEPSISGTMMHKLFIR